MGRPARGADNLECAREALARTPTFGHKHLAPRTAVTHLILRTEHQLLFQAANHCGSH